MYRGMEAKLHTFLILSLDTCGCEWLSSHSGHVLFIKELLILIGLAAELAVYIKYKYVLNTSFIQTF
jgi:hypothetical protein